MPKALNGLPALRLLEQRGLPRGEPPRPRGALREPARGECRLGRGGQGLSAARHVGLCGWGWVGVAWVWLGWVGGGLGVKLLTCLLIVA